SWPRWNGSTPRSPRRSAWRGLRLSRRRRSPQADARERLANGVAFGIGRVDERQAEATDLVPQHGQRGLDWDRVDRHAVEIEDWNQLLVDALRALAVACAIEPDHLLHALTGDVAAHTDPAHAAELQERQDQVVVTRIQV